MSRWRPWTELPATLFTDDAKADLVRHLFTLTSHGRARYALMFALDSAQPVAAAQSLVPPDGGVVLFGLRSFARFQIDDDAIVAVIVWGRYPRDDDRALLSPGRPVYVLHDRQVPATTPHGPGALPSDIVVFDDADVAAGMVAAARRVRKALVAAIRPSLLLDLDNTLADFQSEFLYRWCRMYGLSMDTAATQYDATTWDLWRAVMPTLTPQLRATLGDSDEAVERAVRRSVQAIMAQDGLFANLRPLPGAIEAEEAISDAGFRVTVVTSPWQSNPNSASEKVWWCAQRLSPRRPVITAQDKTMVRGDLLVDDKPHFDMYTREAPAWTQVVYHQPYNAAVDTGHRIRSWIAKPLPELIDDLALAWLRVEAT